MENLSTNEFVSFVEKLNVYRITTSKDVREKFVSYYKEIYNQEPPCTACPGEIESAIQKMGVYKNLLLKTDHSTVVPMEKLMKYKMKEGVVVYSGTLNMMVSCYNCTDDIAEALIKENDSNVQFFTITATDAKTYSATPDYQSNGQADAGSITEEVKKQSKPKRK